MHHYIELPPPSPHCAVDLSVMKPIPVSGMSMSDKYLQLQRQQEAERRRRKEKKSRKKKRGKKKGGDAASSDSEDDVSAAVSVNTEYDVPEVRFTA